MYKTLIVDDQEFCLIKLERLKIWGESSGFIISSRAKNGKEALDLLEKYNYDLILTDICMPIIDGLQLLREIKRRDIATCVVFLSEYKEFSYAREGIILGAFDYLVKPALKEDLLDVLKRVKSYLITYDNPSQKNVPYTDENLDWAYPFEEEKAIIKNLIDRNPMGPSLFTATKDNIYLLLHSNIIKADIMVKKLYHNIIFEVYRSQSWIPNYISRDYFSEIDYLQAGNSQSYGDLYIRKLTYLADTIIRLYPQSSNKTIREICLYALMNPESELKLKFIAEKFFMNNTYLSTLFYTSTKIHYNDYIVYIKMARAQYLLKNTSLKTCEICYQIGYHDTNYFLKQFKKTFGQNASQYRNSEFLDYQI